MVEVTIKCPKCDAGLMDGSRPIDGHPSVCVEGETEGRRGRIWLSSLYGSYRVEAEAEVPEGAITEFFCPACGERLDSRRICDLCDAPMVSFAFAEGGIVQICSRRGCRRHLVEFTDLRKELRTFYEKHSESL